jgi:energy-coupling factor transporter ATP-binding protein EcfA2
MSLAVKITDLEWRYEHRKSFALRGVNLEIEKNSFLGIVGANENGKTTLVSAISGLIPHSFNGIYRGEVKIFDQTVMDMNALELATNVGFVFADPEAQFTAMTVEEEIVFGLENMGFNNAGNFEFVKLSGFQIVVNISFRVNHDCPAILRATDHVRETA